METKNFDKAGSRANSGSDLPKWKIRAPDASSQKISCNSASDLPSAESGIKILGLELILAPALPFSGTEDRIWHRICRFCCLTNEWFITMLNRFIWCSTQKWSPRSVNSEITRKQWKFNEFLIRSTCLHIIIPEINARHRPYTLDCLLF